MKKAELYEATHTDWGFHNRVFVYSSAQPYEPLKVNFYPVATELHDWLLRRGEITLLMKGVSDLEDLYENPFTHDATTLACVTAQIVNDTYAFSHQKSVTCGLDFLGVEIKRVRLYNELVINSARTCEAVIKQLLHCTQFYRKDYEKVALGGLLFKRCRSCDKDGSRADHDISLLGSLAHRYPPMCLAFDCVLGELQKLNQERKQIAAHSGAPEVFNYSFDESTKRSDEDVDVFLKKLIHILDHLGALELLMREELEAALKSPDIGVLNTKKYRSDTIFNYFEKWGFK